MKKITKFLGVAAIAILVNACYDDTALTQRIDDIDSRLTEVETLVKQLNINLGSLKTAVEALQKQDKVTGVFPLADGTGYEITFSLSDPIYIYHGNDGSDGSNGNDGVTPTISLREEDGVEYWFVNGEFLLDSNGDKVPITVKPIIRIKEGRFEVSYDNGKTWIDIGEAGTSGNASDIVFSSITDNDEEVVLTLADGRVISIPKAATFRLNVDKEQVTIMPGGMAILIYTVSGADDKTVVDYFATGGYEVNLMSESQKNGMIAITAPNPLTNGKIYFFAVNGRGETSMRIITFEAGEMKIVLLNTSPISAEGGTLEIQVTTNLEYDVYIEDESWVHYVETKAKRTENISFQIDANPNSEPRSTTVQMLDPEEGEVIESFTIYQEANTSAVGDSYTNTIEDWERTGKITF